MTKSVSCGIILINSNKEVFLCEKTPTPTNSWIKNSYDLPKGLRDDADRDDLTTALRELFEETSMKLDDNDLKEIKTLGIKTYNKAKDLSLFLYFDKNNKYLSKENMDKYKCNSFFIDKKDGKEYSEVKGFKLFNLGDVFNQFYVISKLDNLKKILKSEEEKDDIDPLVIKSINNEIKSLKKQIFLSKSMAVTLHNIENEILDLI